MELSSVFKPDFLVGRVGRKRELEGKRLSSGTIGEHLEKNGSSKKKEEGEKGKKGEEEFLPFSIL